ncbi:MAG: FkbM family methyltransferase [Bacteroidetes bacterium]|nr:FkbM family methyltransferase [Bacteroidota bacterium]
MISKTLFDLYQGRDIQVSRNGNENIISFNSAFSHKRIEFIIRRKTTDIVIFDEVLLKGGYSLIQKICKDYKISPCQIVDAGANVGAATLFFKDLFPGSKIVSIEPENENFKQLEKNIKINGLKDVKCVRAALWYKNEELKVEEGFRGGVERELSFSLKKSNSSLPKEGLVKGITLETILDYFPNNKIDILKVDIEGAESQIFDSFENTIAILSNVRLLAIELHDEVIDRFRFLQFVEQAGFRHLSSGEITYVFKDIKFS